MNLYVFYKILLIKDTRRSNIHSHLKPISKNLEENIKNMNDIKQ